MTAVNFRRTSLIACLGLAAAVAGCGRQESPVARGQYLVAVMGCSDCHTPGGLSPHPDMKRYLGGSDADFQMPGLGVFAPPNLTPDKATGLGNWRSDQIVTAFTTGVRPDGRILAPAMPWTDFSHLSKADAEAVAAYLKSLPAVSHKVPGPAASKPCAPAALECIVQREGA